MPTTSKFSLRYPSLSDAPNIPQDIQNLASDADAAMTVPMCHLVQQVAQSGWTTSTPTAVTFGSGSEVIDTDALHDTSTNTSRVVIGKKLGWWEVSGVYCPAGANTATTLVRSMIYKNGNLIAGAFAGIPQSSITAFVAVPTPVILVEATSVTDYVELMGFQTAGSGTIGTAGINIYVASSITAVWQRPS